MDELKKALEVMGVVPPVSLRELKRIYRDRVKEPGADIASLSEAYRILVEFMERYPFRFSEDEFKRANPDFRIVARFSGIWGKE